MSKGNSQSVDHNSYTDN